MVAASFKSELDTRRTARLARLWPHPLCVRLPPPYGSFLRTMMRSGKPRILQYISVVIRTHSNAIAMSKRFSAAGPAVVAALGNGPTCNTQIKAAPGRFA